MTLGMVGFSWDRLERLAWKALSDEKRSRSIVLDEDRDERAHQWLFEVGLEWASRYDAALANGTSFATSCYRRMRPRLHDFLRREHGDERRGAPLFQVPTDPSLLPDGALLEGGSFDQAVDAVSASLPSRPLWTLHHLARPIAEDGVTLAAAAAAARVSEEDAGELLEELGWHLGRRSSVTAGEGDPILDLLLEWSVAA